MKLVKIRNGQELNLQELIEINKIINVLHIDVWLLQNINK